MRNFIEQIVELTANVKPENWGYKRVWEIILQIGHHIPHACLMETQIPRLNWTTHNGKLLLARIQMGMWKFPFISEAQMDFFSYSCSTFIIICRFSVVYFCYALNTSEFSNLNKRYIEPLYLKVSCSNDGNFMEGILVWTIERFSQQFQTAKHMWQGTDQSRTPL